MSRVIVREDNTKAWSAAFRKAIVQGLMKCGMLGEGYAKSMCPVDTGNLRNSITNDIEPSEPAVYIGTNVEYAPHVELGTSNPKQRAQPYLKPAVTRYKDQYGEIMREALGG